MIKKFKVNVMREAEYIVEIDTELCGEEFISEFKRYFYDIEDLEGHAKNIGETLILYPEDRFIEGYGYITVNGMTQYGKTAESGISVTVEYDEVDDAEVEEI